MKINLTVNRSRGLMKSYLKCLKNISPVKMFDTKMKSTIPKTRKHIKVEIEPQLKLEDLGGKK